MNKKSISVIVGLICVAITVASIFFTLNRAFFEIPVFEMVFGEDRVDELQEGVDEVFEEIEDASEEEQEEIEDSTGMSYRKIKRIVKTPSLNSIITLSSEFEGSDMGDIATNILKLSRAMLIVFGIVIALFSLMGALLPSKALTIVALVISIPFYIFIVGWLMLVLFAAISIIHIVLIPKKEKAPVTPVNYVQ